MRLGSVHREADGATVRVNAWALVAVPALVFWMRIAWLLGGLGR